MAIKHVTQSVIRGVTPEEFEGRSPIVTDVPNEVTREALDALDQDCGIRFSGVDQLMSDLDD